MCTRYGTDISISYDGSVSLSGSDVGVNECDYSTSDADAVYSTALGLIADTLRLR